MMVVFDAGTGGGGTIIELNSTDGSTSDTSVVIGGYDGKSAKLLETQQTAEKFGPIFKPYDPAWSALLAMNF